MASLSSSLSLSLPPPHNNNSNSNNKAPPLASNRALAVAGASPQQQQPQQPPKKSFIPSYEERCRAAVEAAAAAAGSGGRPKMFVPRQLSDFGDGGAFPEIHVAQYPRHMGNPHLLKQKTGTTAGAGSNSESGTAAVSSSSSRALVNVEIDKDGQVSYDAIVKGGSNRDKLVYSRHEDILGNAKPSADDIALPTPQEEAAEAARTQAALQALISTKVALDKPKQSTMIQADTSRNIESKTQFIQYTPRPDAPGYNPAAAVRVVQMVPAQVDPLQPPKHKHLKAPAGPADDPVPVLHAPVSKKLTAEERNAWNVPACISNWKNSRGYTIPLDKRLAADGRGWNDTSVNAQQFAVFSESLYEAERQARHEVKLRAQVQKKLALQQKERREEELRALAQQARMERSSGNGGMATGTSTSANTTVQDNSRVPEDDDDDNDDESSLDHESIDAPNNEDDNDDVPRRSSADNNNDKTSTTETEEQVAAQQREKLRLERKRERERELRREQQKHHKSDGDADAAAATKKPRRLEEDRDISEKIALGGGAAHAVAGDAGMDSRLYHQSAGMDSGFGAEDDYNTYTQPLFGDKMAANTAAGSVSIYRPSRGEEAEYQLNADEQYQKLIQGATSKFQPDKGFAGAEGDASHRSSGAGPRTAPVQFEKSKSNN